ncbi:hypothetical protein [Amycolatopsis dongchuanensis]|uniref:4-amino-4-deoxy-L-arabinose transferase n=1 Tax=Amycolatopsis dongchuanensis TaxID=1070866 RepID=A0ABP8VR86_9PSEU
MAQLVDVSPDTGELPRIGTPGRRWGLRRAPALWIGALALVVGFGFVLVSLAFNSGRLFGPLDDVYIHLQYGSQLGAGHFFRFNTGDDISAGASSMLYAFVLGAAYAIGFHYTLLLAFAIGFNVCCFAVASAFTCLLATRLLHRTPGIWAGLLVALSGPLAWGAASGMEVGLVMMLVTGLLLTFVTEQDAARFRWTPVVGALLALVRPEGLILACALTCAVLWTLWIRRRLAGPARTVRRAVWSLLPGVVGVAQLTFYKLATGTFSANGIQSKSLLHDQPEFYVSQFVDRAGTTLRNLLGIFLGFSGQEFTFPGGLLVCLGGVAYLMLNRRLRPLVLATLAGLGGAVLSLSTLDSALVHELRYFQPFLPLFVIFVVAGFTGAAQLIARARTRRLALHSVLAVVLAFSVVSLPIWSVRYARAAAAIRDSDVSYAAYLKGNLPPEANIAIKDVGAVAYLGGHHVVDLLGLGTNGFAEAANNEIGSLYEAVRHLPPERRPDYFATYDTGPGPSMKPLRDVGVLEQPALASFDVHAPEDSRGFLMVPFRVFSVTKADWSLVDNGDAAPVPGDVRDHLNVAYLTDEKAHDYAFLPAQDGLQPFTSLARDGDVIDSGRHILGGEEFTLHNAVPGRAATLTARIAMHGTVPEASVLVNGKPAGRWLRDGKDSTWETYTFTIPAELVDSDTLHIEIRQPRPVLNPYPDYVSYGYWLTQ